MLRQLTPKELNAAEVLADAFSTSAGAPEACNSYQENPLLTLQRARWFLDTQIKNHGGGDKP